MTRIAMQAEKEWCSFRRDRLGLALAVVLPLATLLLFGCGVRLQNHNIPVIVNDEDATDASRKLVDQLMAPGTMHRVALSNSSNPLSALKRGDAKAEIEVPKGFSSTLKGAKSAQFNALVDGSDVSSAETIRQTLSLASMKAGAELTPIDLHSLFVVPDVEIWFNRDAKETPFIVSGVFAIVLWMYPALLAAVAIARELEHETIVQVFASGLNAAEFLIGKGTVYALTGIVLAAMMMVLSHFLFKIELTGDLGLLALSTCIYVLAAVSFGLFAGVMTREENVAVQATATGGFFPALLLSGFVYPLANIPFPISLVAYVVPARYYIEVCRDVFMKATGSHEMWWRVVLIMAFGLFLFVCAWARLRKMQMED